LPDPFAYLFALDQFGIKFGLDNIRTLVDALGHPERSFRSIHIAGTNGKGSVTAMVDAGLRAAGHRAARYTSPHLVDITERFVVDGQAVSRALLGEVLSDVQALIVRLLAAGKLEVQPTFFEVTTAAAFEVFRRAGVDVAVCEAGLGGRLDATNVLSPIATAITSIDFDHEKYLGATLSEIAREKAGIIKPGVPVVIGPIADEAFEAIRQTAAARQAPLCAIVSSDSSPLVALDPYTLRPIVEMRTSRHDCGRITLGLRGRHQIVNARIAAELLEQLDAAGVTVTPKDIVNGLMSVAWPGRLDIRQLPNGRQILLDAAHNPGGARSLAAFLNEGGWAGAPLVFGAMVDKDTRGMLDPLLPSVGAVIVTRPSNARAAAPAALADIIATLDAQKHVRIEPQVSSALEAAWSISSRIIAAGSIFLLGDVFEELDQA
jgi:dihydrofolate synthase/folylpolyglutamate synthase